MKELNMVEVDEVGGGLAFIPLLIVTAAGSFAGGYVAGKISKAVFG
jgi:hypothetical protein